MYVVAPLREGVCVIDVIVKSKGYTYTVLLSFAVLFDEFIFNTIFKVLIEFGTMYEPAESTYVPLPSVKLPFIVINSPVSEPFTNIFNLADSPANMPATEYSQVIFLPLLISDVSGLAIDIIVTVGIFPSNSINSYCCP